MVWQNIVQDMAFLYQMIRRYVMVAEINVILHIVHPGTPKHWLL